MDSIDQVISEAVAANVSKPLEELTDNFTSYPMYWNDGICFTKNPLMAIPGIALGLDF